MVITANVVTTWVDNWDEIRSVTRSVHVVCSRGTVNYLRLRCILGCLL